MRHLNYSREEIEQYFSVPRYRNPQDLIRGRLNYVGGWEAWQERRLQIQESEIERQTIELDNMARFDAYYARHGRGRGRGGRDGRGRDGRGEGRGSGRGYREREEFRDVNGGRGRPKGNRNRGLGRGRAEGSMQRSDHGRAQPGRTNSEGGESQGRNMNLIEQRAAESRSPGRQSNDVDQEVWNNMPERQLRVPEPRAPNPYESRAADGFRNNTGEEDNTVNAQQPNTLPVAEMRSNDAPQDDSMPVGNVVGVVNNPNGNIPSREDNRNRVLMREARNESRASNRVARAIQAQEARSRDRTVISQQLRPVIPHNWTEIRRETLREEALNHPLSIDRELNIWVHPEGRLVFDNRRNVSTTESMVMIRQILDTPENFTWSQLSPLSSRDRWEVAVSVAALMASVYSGEVINTNPLFVSHIFNTCSMQEILGVITKDHLARAFCRKYKKVKPFILTPETAFPLINENIVTKQTLAKLRSPAICPVVALELMRNWTQRSYPYHVVALINQINTYVNPARVKKILFDEGEFHAWATEVVPGAIFDPPAPRNIVHVYESIADAREAQLEQQSLQEVLELEIDIPDLEEANEPEQAGEDGGDTEASLTGVQSQAIPVVTGVLVEDDPFLERGTPSDIPTSSRKEIGQDLAEAAISGALERAAEEGREIVLSGLYGAPESVEGFIVREYINLDAPTEPPIEAYPQEPENSHRNIDAIRCYVEANYSLAKKEVNARLKLMGPEEIETLATKPGQLERIIFMMQLLRYIPVPRIITRCNGRYEILEKDPALNMADGMDYTTLLQVTMQPSKDPEGFFEELSTLRNAFSPEQKLDVGEVKQVMPNLTEQPLNQGGENKVLRLRIESSFCFNSFMSLTIDESSLRNEWFKFISEWTYDFKVIASRPIHFRPIALFPGILPEHGIDAIREAILKMGTVRESPKQIAMDWTNDCSRQVSEAAFTVLYAETESSLSKIITEVPITVPYGRVQGVGVREIESPFHREAISKHSNRMQFQQVLEVQNVPSWTSTETTMHPPTAPGSIDYSDLTIAQYFKRFQADGTIGDYDTGVFQEVTVGNMPTTIVMSIAQENIGVIEAKMEEIKELLQGTIGQITSIEVRVWPELEISPVDQMQDQQEQVQSESEEQEQEEELRQQEEQQGVANQEEYVDEVDQVAAEVQRDESLPANFHEEFQEIKAHLIKLTKAVEMKESLTAPLTSVTASSNGEISPISTASLADALYLAWERAHKENGFLYKSANQDSENMVQVLKDALACATPVVQESVRESVDESSVHIQQTVQESIQDSTAAMLRMITNPSKEHAGEIATIVKDHLAPYFEAMAQAITRIAMVAEISSRSPEHAAMGNAQAGVAPAYTLLQDIKQTMRLILRKIGSGQDALNRVVMDVETSIARERRIDSENEIKARNYSRRLLELRHVVLQQLRANPEAEKLAPLMDIVEEGIALQISFQEHFGMLFRMSEWQQRQDLIHSPESASEEEEDVKSNGSIEQEEEVSVVSRKTPPEEQVFEAGCELAAVAEADEGDEAAAAIEAAELEFALKMSLQDQHTKPSALSVSALAEKRAAEENEKAEEQRMRQETENRVEQDIAPFLASHGANPPTKNNETGEISASQSPTDETERLDADGEEEVPGTPLKKDTPNVVTPKDKKQDADGYAMAQIIAEAQQEVSNLTTPTTLVGPHAAASEDSEAETVVDEDDLNAASEPPKAMQSDQESIASRTRGSKNPKK